MLWKTDFFTAFDFGKADRSVGFGAIWSQVTLLHHQQNCLLSWLYMNTLFTSANSPKVMGLHHTKVWRKWCLPGVFIFVRRPKMREAEPTEKVNVTSLKTSMENVTVFCCHYCTISNGIHVLKVLAPDHWADPWRKSIKNATCFGYHRW